MRLAAAVPVPAPGPGDPDRDAPPLTLRAFLLAGDTSAEGWVRTLLREELPAQAYGSLLLRPGAMAPVALASRGRQVCSCFDVSEASIVESLRAIGGDEAVRLERLQARLQCGTHCGSGLPDLRRLLRDNASRTPTASWAPAP